MGNTIEWADALEKRDTYGRKTEICELSNGLQDATVILTYPNFHICPWTKDELPDSALLPALYFIAAKNADLIVEKTASLTL